MNVRLLFKKSQFIGAAVLALLAGLAGRSAAAAEETGYSWLLPEDAGTYGHKVDVLYGALLYSTSIAFLIVVAALAYFCVRYRAKKGSKAQYTHGDSWKAMGVTGTLALMVFICIDMNTVRLSNAAAKDMQHPPEGAMRVHVQAQQFSWMFHYPGADGKFGRTDAKFISDSNLFGVDPADPDGKDDVMNEGVICVPVNTPVVLEMRSRDVIHSFFLPNFRVKQDVVPGMRTQLWFQATRTGTFEIACAELCGMLHSQMSGILSVRTQAEFEKWLKEKAEN